MDPVSALASLDRMQLSGPVARALGREQLAITNWQGEALQRGLSEVYRLAGTASAQDQTLPWSLILKVARVWGEDDPTALFYWKREPLAYQSGLLDDLPGALVAPRCYSIDEPAPGVVWLWLEELSDTCADPWSLSCYGRAARHLGRFNGAYLVGRPLPSAPWLSQRFLPRLVPSAQKPITSLPDLLEHPLVRRACPSTTADGLVQLWQDHEVFLAALERVPPTFCHRDAARNNLFLLPSAAGEGHLGIIDWPLAGQGVLGEEVATLVLTSFLCFSVGLTDLPELEETILRHYLDGLQEAGWHGDPQLVRLGYTLAATLRFGLNFLPGMLPSVAQGHTTATWEQVMKRPIEEIVERRGQALSLVLHYAEEARTLIR